MKKIITFLLLFLCNNLIFAQINLSLPPTVTRQNIEDFYGLNGQNTLSPTSMYFARGVKDALNRSKASYLRYPGGTVANYWDWQEGWFFRNLEKNGALSLDVDLQNKDRLSPIFFGSFLNESGSNYIQDFINTIANTGTKPLFVLNPLTSDLQYQIAMLLEAKLQGLDVKRVEIGNEFYLSTTAYQEKFASVEDYANLTSAWSTSIKSYLGSNMQICAVGSNNDYTGSTNIRRANWNTNLYNSMTGSLPEALAIHHYRNALPPSATAFSSQTFFQKVIDDNNDLNNYIYQFGGSSTNPPSIWLTEYNLFDRDLQIHGTWYHGLYTAFSTLKFLENSRIKACNLHAQSGNYTFGNFFNTTDGLKQLGSFLTCNPPASTAVYGKTSEGIAMEQIAIALKDAVSGSKIDFTRISGPQIPMLGGANQALYGWVFNENSVNNASVIILNLSENDLPNVNVSAFGFTTNSDLLQINLSNPSYYATGFENALGIYNFIDCSGATASVNANLQKVPSNNTISLPKYSITRIKRNPIWIPRLYALNETVKAGSKVIVSVLNKDVIPFDWDSINGNGNDSSSYIEFYPTRDTTITVRYSIPGSLTISTVNKTISVIQNPIRVAINASTTSYCPGSTPITLSATAIGGTATNYKYIWITTPTNDEFPDFNKGVGNTQTIAVKPDFPTTYTVYVTDGQTVAKTSITINVPTAFNLKPEYTTCIGHTPINIDILSNPQNGIIYSYRWNNVTTILNPSPGIAINLSSSFSTKNVLTVYASDPSLGCIVSKSSTINFYQCCGTSTSSSIVVPPTSNLDQLKTLANGIFSIQSSNNGKLSIDCRNTTGNTDITFNGDFHIQDIPNTTDDFNTELELISCVVNFSEGASATVEPGYTFTIENCNLSNACNKMWKGIIIDAGRLTTRPDVSIKNAEVAVNSYPGSNLDIRRTNFENNVIGIEADHQSADGDNLQFFNIRGNDFTLVGRTPTNPHPLLDPYVGSTLSVGDLPLAGMLLNRVNASIGVPNTMGGTNEFSNLNAGIICENSNLNIRNCNFLDLEEDNTYSYPAGNSIYAVGNCSIYGDDLMMQKTQGNLFPSNGIYLYKGNDLNIRNSTFNNLEFAIQNHFSNFKNYNISNNNFKDCKTGIEWWESTSENVAEISYNKFEAILDPSNNHPLRPDLEAIHIFGGSKDFPFSIFENKINNHLVGIFAMCLDGRQFPQYINDNQINLGIDGDYVLANSFEFRGISLQNCDYLNVKHNEINWNSDVINFNADIQGIRFEKCRTTLFDLNKLQKLNKGFYSAGSCEETALTCNEMNECYPNGMFLDGADLPNQGSICGPNFNEFNGNYDPAVNSYLKLAGNVSGNLINWYYQGTQLITNPLYLEPSDQFIANAISTTNCSTSPCGNAERYLGNVEQRSEYLDKIVADSIFYSQFPQENDLYDLDYAYEVMTADSTFVINAVYEQFFQAIEQGNIGKLTEISELLKSGEVNLAYIKNNTLLYQNVMEQNAKIVNEVLLNKLMSNTIDFDSLQKNTLKTIAYQPAMLGGKGVYNARSLLRLRIEDGASSLRQSALNNISQISTFDLKLYPNPAKDEFTVSSSELISRIEIFDLSGKIIEKLNGEFNQKSISITNYKNGFYFVDVHMLDDKVKQFKLGIIH